MIVMKHVLIHAVLILLVNNPFLSLYAAKIDAKAPAYSSAVDNFLMTGSEPLKFSKYPLGIYDAPPSDLSTVKKAGLEMAHQYHSTQSLSEAEQYLKIAGSLGLKVRQNMPGKYLHRESAFWKSWITRLAQYKTLAIWYLPEEPKLKDYQGMRNLYHYVKKFDPLQRPVATFTNNYNQISFWCNVVDIMMVGPYPEYADEPRSNVTAWIRGARKACPNNPVVAVPQFFDGIDFEDHGEGKKGHPTAKELRCDAYTALIAGAKGLDWFYFPTFKKLPEFGNHLEGLVAEIKTIRHIIDFDNYDRPISVKILSGPSVSPPTSTGKELFRFDSIQTLTKANNNEIYLFASNIGADKLIVTFENLPDIAKSAMVLFENRSLPIQNGEFTDSFLDSDVHIYHIILSSNGKFK